MSDSRNHPRGKCHWKNPCLCPRESDMLTKDEAAILGNYTIDSYVAQCLRDNLRGRGLLDGYTTSLGHAALAAYEKACARDIARKSLGPALHLIDTIKRSLSPADPNFSEETDVELLHAKIVTACCELLAQNEVAP